MALKLFEKQRAEITWADGQGSISVRGLSAFEFLAVFDPVAKEMGALFDIALQDDPRKLLNDKKLTGSFVSLLLKEGPSLLARMVAVAAEVPDREDEVSRLPPDVLLTAAEQICLFSFDNKERFFDLVRRLGDRASVHSAAISGKRH